MTLTWQEPESTGGAKIESYIIEMRKSGETDFSEVCQVSGSKLSTILEELDDDTDYEVAIRAKNVAGVSDDVTQLESAVKTKRKIGRCI